MYFHLLNMIVELETNFTSIISMTYSYKNILQ